MNIYELEKLLKPKKFEHNFSQTIPLGEAIKLYGVCVRNYAVICPKGCQGYGGQGYIFPTTGGNSCNRCGHQFNQTDLTVKVTCI